MKKVYLKDHRACRVTFTLPRAAVKKAKSVHVVGDFNDWESEATPLKRQKDGSFAATIDLQVGREYRFRYLIDKNRWENDWAADRYEPSGYASEENSIVVV